MTSGPRMPSLSRYSTGERPLCPAIQSLTSFSVSLRWMWSFRPCFLENSALQSIISSLTEYIAWNAIENNPPSFHPRLSSYVLTHSSFWNSASSLLLWSSTTYEMTGLRPISTAAFLAISGNQYWSLKVTVPDLIISRQATFVA